MTYSDLQKTFVNNISNEYDQREALNVFWVVLLHLNKWSRIQYEMHRNSFVEPDKFESFQGIGNRLNQGEPVQYITESTEFYGNNHIVSPSVLIPRPETEELVDWIVSERAPLTAQKALDVGTGSGCIINSLALNLEGEFYGADISKDALAIAERNSKELKTGVIFIHLDILTTNQKDFGYDIIVSNPPYIPVKDKYEMKSNVLDFEPDIALFVSDDNPLTFYRAIINYSIRNLKKGGFLYFEIHEGYANELKQLVEGFKCGYQFKKDMQGKNRMLKIWDLV